jgi:hypothetical protein
MPSATLQKALEGKTDALIKMSDLIQSGKLLATDLAAIKSIKTVPNKNQDYLLALFHYTELYKETDFKKAIKLLKPWAERGDSFAQSLLGNIYCNQSQPELGIKYLQEACNQGNPLAMVNTALSEVFPTDPIDHPNRLSIQKKLSMLSNAYNQLTPNYKKVILEHIGKIWGVATSNEDAANRWYELALFYKKIDLKTETYEALHKAINHDGTSKFIKKLIKTFDYFLNKDAFFTKKIDAAFIDGFIDFLDKNTQKVENEMTENLNADTIEDLKNILHKQDVSLKNVQYIMQEKGGEFSAKQKQSLVPKLKVLADKIALCEKKLDYQSSIAKI